MPSRNIEIVIHIDPLLSDVVNAYRAGCRSLPTDIKQRVLNFDELNWNLLMNCLEVFSEERQNATRV